MYSESRGFQVAVQIAEIPCTDLAVVVVPHDEAYELIDLPADHLGLPYVTNIDQARTFLTERNYKRLKHLRANGYVIEIFGKADG